MATKRQKKTRIKSNGERLRLSVFRSNKGIYAQIIDDQAGKTVVAVSSLKMPNSQNTEGAKATGKELAISAVKSGVTKVVFDRGAYPYKGRIKALAESARENGLLF